jgi:hypothetical protein
MISNPLLPKELGMTLLVFAGGTLLALALSRRPCWAAAAAEEWCAVPRWQLARASSKRTFLRRWPTAGLAMLVLAALFSWLMLTPGL